MRENYRNGDEIALTATGCDGCSPATINGVLCHETGCPEAWRDHPRDCFECGCEFYPESRDHSICPDCVEWLQGDVFEEEDDPEVCHA